jgi:hypothetical protein
VKPYQNSILWLAVLLSVFYLWRPAHAGNVDTVRIDWAYYNPISLVLKDKKWLEDDLASSGIKVEWVQSLGSNKALEFLRGKSVDFGSTAGAAAAERRTSRRNFGASRPAGIFIVLSAATVGGNGTAGGDSQSLGAETFAPPA